MSETPITCLVADDHPAILDSVSRFLTNGDVDVVSQTSTGEETLAELERTQPAVALLDLNLPDLDGPEFVRAAHRCARDTAIVVYTGDSRATTLTAALDAGAQGFVAKDSPLGEVLRAVEAAASGRVYIDPLLAGDASRKREPLQLTTREREVLRLLAEGMRYEEIARTLFLAPETVRTHTRKAAKKLGCATRTQAVAVALREGLI